MERANITELARKWGVSRRFIYNALEAGRIPGAEFIDGRWHIPEDAENPIKRLVTPKYGYISAKEAAEKWGASKKAVCSAAKTGRIPGAEFINDRWHIPEDAENPLKMVVDPKPGYISTKEAAEKWGVFQSSVCNAANEGRIPGAEFVGNRWHIPEDIECPVDRRKDEENAGYTTIREIAQRWGITNARVHQLCQDGRIPGAVYENRHWRIPVDAKKPVVTGPVGTCSASQKAEEWGISPAAATRLCALGVVPDAVHIGRLWHIPEDAVYPLEGYIALPQLAEKWDFPRQKLWKFCDEGRIPGAKRIGRDWYVPADAKKPADKRTERKLGYISPTKMAEKWGVSRNFVCEVAKEGRIPGAEFVDGRWHIPEDAVCPEDRRGKRRE